MHTLPRVTYVVMNENTLGYFQQESASLNALHCKTGGHDWRNGAVSPFDSSIRPATLKDFNDFNTSPPPWIIIQGETHADRTSPYEFATSTLN